MALYLEFNTSSRSAEDYIIHWKLNFTTYNTLNLKFNTYIPLKIIILSVILELPLSVRGVGRRTQPISKLLNDLLITSALNPTYFSELLSNLYYSPIKKLENIFIKLLSKSVINYKSRSKAIVYDFVEKVFESKKTKLYEENS
jgi:hypothetical protein